jgi:hypothetical protein
MNDSLAKIISSVLAGLGGPPPELLSPKEVAGKVLAIVRRRLVQLSQSDQNQDVRHKDLYPTTRQVKLSGVVDLEGGTPLWVERRVSTSGDVSVIVPVINLDSIEEARERGDERVCFYSEQDTLYLTLSYLPGGARHRLWYDPNTAISFALSDRTRLPVSFNEMIIDEGIVKSLPLVMQHAAEMETQERPVSKAQILAWEAIGGESRDSLKNWDKLWETHVWASRDSQRGRNRRPILARGGGS